MRKIFYIAISIIMVGIVTFFLLRSNGMIINSSFATSALLKYNYIEKSIDLEITDVNDIKELKKILRGLTRVDNPSCGFTIDISITLTDGEKSISFCPACDGCPIIQIGESNRYIKITQQQREQLDEILKKYGMTFPCV